MSTLRVKTPRVFVPLLEPAPYKGAWGGRGSGKSHFFAEMLVDDAIRQHVRAACLREVQNSIKDSVKQLIEDKIRDLGQERRFRITEREIIGPNDSLFIFRGLQNHTASSIKSLEGFNRAWLEEAQTISKKSLDITIPTFRVDDTEMWFSWNPNQPTDPVDQFLRAEPRPDAKVVKALYYDNPFFPAKLRADMEWDKARDPDKYAHVWLGEYERNSEARVFRNWRIGELDVPKGTRPYFGADWGFSVDPTVLIRCYVLPGRVLYIEREAYRVGCRVEDTPKLFDTIDKGQARNWPLIGDSSNPQIIDYMRRNGYPKIAAARKGPGSIEEGIEFLKNYDIVIHPSCVHAADEFSLYSYKTDKLTGEVLPELEDKKNHVIDACRYAVENLRRPPPTAIIGSFRTVR